MEKTKWTTKEGKVIHIKDMETGHLINTVKMLERNAERCINQMESTALHMMSCVNGDMATLCAEQALDEAISTSIAEVLEETPYEQMLKELKKRK